MRYGVVGTGAIGGYYGAKLARSGQEVHFLFHNDYKYVRQHGMQVNSPDGDFHLDNVLAYDSVDNMPKCDVVIVALKTVKQDLLTTLLPPLLKEDTLVLLIQNGLGVEEDLAREIPGVQLAAGLAFICVAKTRQGVVDHLDLGTLNIGDYNCRTPGRVSQLVSELRAAGVNANEVEYLEARWKKAVWNMPFNGLTVVLDSQTDELLANKASNELVRDMMLEVIGAARAQGVTTLSDDYADQLIEMTKNMKPYSPSMKLDWDYHRPMEIHYLYTRPIEIAKSAGFDMPKLKMLEEELIYKEQQRGEF